MSLNVQTKVSEETIEALEEECKYIKRVARDASLDAIEETFRQGRPITTVEDDFVVRKYPDGRIEKIKKLEKTSVIPKKRVYKPPKIQE